MRLHICREREGVLPEVPKMELLNYLDYMTPRVFIAVSLAVQAFISFHFLVSRAGGR